MKKTCYIISTILIMLITSWLSIRIVDATVQIDDDIVLLIIMLVALNAVIGILSFFLYRKIITRPPEQIGWKNERYRG